MIGVWAGCSQRMWLFISNDQQFAHFSSVYANITLLLPISPHNYSPSLHFYLLLLEILPFFIPLTNPAPPPLSLPLPPPLFLSKWCHQCLLRPLPRLITQSAAGCSWMHLYGLAVRARGQAGGYICHDSNALTQRSVLNTVAWTGPWRVWTHIQTCTHTGNQVRKQTSVCVHKRMHNETLFG